MDWRERLGDFAHGHPFLAYAAGTGLLAACAGALAGPGRRGRALGGWAASLALGALLRPCVDPTLQTWGPALVHGRRDEAKIALTFDDGPCPPYTDRILDLLAAHGARATFFVIGSQADRHPGLVHRMDAEGHLVGQHTWTHPNLLLRGPARTRAELIRGTEAVTRALGRPPAWFRPPYGCRTPWALAQARALGQTTALWSSCPRDWESPPPATLLRRVEASLSPGDILLLHDGGGDRSATVEALPALLGRIRALGCEAVRLDELTPP